MVVCCVSSDDLSASAVTGCTGASQGFLSRTGSLDNLLADFDGDQVQSAVSSTPNHHHFIT